ncbi:rod shape-determining protein MreD [Pseudalkalibacillus caeni]|uniref:Rod shape-determining protein MreD n=1 Tax=Exobacillus caeni TaxID=2574798 RepID=A0A5R9FF74_9BACL|nr:rod shape-determining protein MreD [Pseudalkalibacillus caeni]TLS39244.1 rod shape-determining protein MreD [Pseudalkalibacillus caeni]
MRQVILPALMFLFFILEGTVMQVFAPEQYGMEISLIPRFALAIILLASIVISPGYGVLYGIVFGLLNDLVYSDLIGIYMFSMGLIAYIIGYISKIFHINIFVALVLSLLGISMLEFLVYEFFLLLDRTTLPFDSFLYDRFLPTLVLNGVFVLLIYYPIRGLLFELSDYQRQES